NQGRKANVAVRRVSANGFPARGIVAADAKTRLKKSSRVVAEMPMSGWLRVHARRVKRQPQSRRVSNISFRIGRRSSVVICRCVRAGLVMRTKGAKKAANVATASVQKAALTRMHVHRVLMQIARKRRAASL